VEGGGSEAADYHCEMLEMTDGCGEGGGKYLDAISREASGSLGWWRGGLCGGGGGRLVERVGCDWVV